MNIFRFFSRFFVTLMVSCFIMLGCFGTLYAAETEWASGAHSQARLIIDHDVLGPEQSVKLGIQIRLQPGWHSYWINPGAAGDAPHIDIAISGRKLAKQGPIQWPVPILLKEGDLSAYAYEGTFLLPQLLELAGQGAVTFKVHAEWLVCAEVCVPEQKDFTLSVPSDSQSVMNPGAASLFEEAKQHLPQSSVFEGQISPDNSLIIKSGLFSKDSVQRAYFFPFKTGLVDPNAEQRLHVGKGFITLSLKADSALGKKLAAQRPEGLLALTDSHGQTIYVTLKTSEEAAAPLSEFREEHENIGFILLCAFLGGMILNAMPCVFPVLAMKSLSLIKLKGAEQRERRKSALYYTAGIIGSFVALGGVLLSLRWVGRAVGWGFQFQSPYFVAFMCWLLLLLALNLFDVFYIGLGKIGTALSTGVSPNDGLRDHKITGWHDVMAGFVAVLLATPCVAPFMGVAVAAALSHSAFTGIVIFTFMGLGLAFPYILLANIPALVSLLPHSGPWMGVFKKFLAFPLLASCVWLLWVGTLQNGAGFIISVAGGGILLALSAWIYGMSQNNRIVGKYTRLNIVNYSVIILCVISAFLMLIIQVTSGSVIKGHQQARSQNLSTLPEGWEGFSYERLEQLRKEGKPVFVDMTASWCITCLVNERVALKIPSTLAAFRQHHVTVMVGDWTKGSKEISRYLRHYGRDGVPLYVYYPPRLSAEKSSNTGEHKGIMLPQILTPGLIITTLTQN